MVTRFALAAVETVVLAITVVAGGRLLSGALVLPGTWLLGTPFASWRLPALLLLAAVGVPAAVAAALELADHEAAPLASLVHGVLLVLVVAVQLVLLERYLVFQPVALVAGATVLGLCALRGPGAGVR